MTTKHALPGLVAGAIGLVVGVAGFVTDQAFAGVVAGLFALGAAAACVRLASRLEDEHLLRSRLAEAEDAAAQVVELADAESADAELPADAQLPADAGADGIASDGVHDGSADVAADERLVQDAEPGNDPSPEASTSLIDHSTGLFSEGFFYVALETRIAAARRHLRPVAVVLIEVVQGVKANEPTSLDAYLVADTLTETLREADTACRLQNGYFALLLEDTPENGAIWTVERIRRQLVATQEGVTVWAGIACYPAHAFTSDGIIEAAEQALVSAREWRQDRIEVAAAATD